MLLENTNSIFPGATFPDWMYAVGPDHDVGEVAHWPPFMNAALELYKEKYNNLKTPESRAFVSFFAGILSHSIADINWHGLR